MKNICADKAHPSLEPACTSEQLLTLPGTVFSHKLFCGRQRIYLIIPLIFITCGEADLPTTAYKTGTMSKAKLCCMVSPPIY